MKTQITKELEKAIVKRTSKQGTFGVLECTIGWYGKEIVDYITYDTNGVFRCYEIKCSLSDFHSKASKTFIGNYNYYVLTKELYEQVKDEIPDYIGIYVFDDLVKKAKWKALRCPEYLNTERAASDVLKDSMIRSLSREAMKLYKSDDDALIQQKEREINSLTREQTSLHKELRVLKKLLLRKFGRNYIEVIEQLDDKYKQYL